MANIGITLKSNLSLSIIASYLFDCKYLNRFLTSDINNYSKKILYGTQYKLNDVYIEKLTNENEELVNTITRYEGKDNHLVYSSKYSIKQNGKLLSATTSEITIREKDIEERIKRDIQKEVIKIINLKKIKRK